MNSRTTFLTRKEGSTARDLAALLILFGTSFFIFLGRLPLLEPDEGRYAEIPREMLEKGDFITPFLNYVKYFEKPPLLYWLNALSFKLFGFTEFAARFPSALMGLGGVLLTYLIGRKLFGRREGLFAALILGTSLGFVVLGRYNIIDMPLTFCMTATLGFFILAAQEREKHKGLYYYLFYIFAAFSVLAKGLIGIVLPGGVIFFYLLLGRRWRLLREMRLFTGIILFLLVCAPWFVLVSLKNPEFPRFFFIHEHFERFLTKVHGRYEPAWFFIPVLFGFMLPWSFLLPGALVRVLRERDTPAWHNRLYLALWLGIIFGFFSVSDSKLIPYILPVFPAVALLVGELLSSTLDRRSQMVSVSCLLVSVILIIVGCGAIAYPHLVATPKVSLTGISIIGAILVAEGLLALVALRRKKLAGILLVFSLMSFFLNIIGPPYILEQTATKKSSRKLGLLARQQAGPDDVVASYNLYRQGFSFYAGRRVLIANERNELDFGSRQGDQSAWFVDSASFNQLWDSPRRVVALIKEETIPQLSGEVSTPVRVIECKGDSCLISNR